MDLQNVKARYNARWVITYKGRAYVTVYGKKKAYELFVRLSHCMIGLEVEPAPRRVKKRSAADIAAYNQRWREQNPDKVKAYNRRSYLKRQHKQHDESRNDAEGRKVDANKEA